MTNLITAMVFSSLVTNWDTIAIQQPKLDSSLVVTMGREIQLMTVRSNTYALFDWNNKPVKLLVESVPVAVPEMLRRVPGGTPTASTNWGNPWIIPSPTNLWIITTNKMMEAR